MKEDEGAESGAHEGGEMIEDLNSCGCELGLCRHNVASSESICSPLALSFLLRSKLTAKERVIAWLALQGRTVKDIGERVQCSDKTVKHHLYAIYDKLGVGSKQELATRVFPISEEVPRVLIDALPYVANRRPQ
jgi:DNA-binding NarL/FixJ family response regulator